MRVIGQHASGKSNVLSSKSSTLAIPWKRVALYVTIASGFFLLGFVPMWLKAGAAIEQRDAAQRGVDYRLGTTRSLSRRTSLQRLLDVQQTSKQHRTNAGEVLTS